jgi:hypothetical protein
MTREAKMFIMSAGVALTSVGLLVIRETGLAESDTGRWLAISIVALVLIALAAVLWRRP